ncbi:MAG: translation elongation factor 4 [Thermodesulfovibrio sp.]|uniref:translation elongation factor 4 n=1 Tax=unclassified Thermodesulfovibrio TaxID=2645936 RepID=UPI00083AA623|nr:MULTISPECIES: translation elongation factor 4 [unclassified Thermodesulfovibrio]MDI1472899.1 translation elongation factor 4 [Thermodesulfovibrio sp. 1176]MDI6714861.1 translation elongation factor 4 [Thermodesulfovibrio sp.]ODA44753.1 Translation elongation factor LepA [Thermodesulfovibrio sp. N1]
MKNIRNFSIIAHIDHGKSTLADRLLEFTGAVNLAGKMGQILDSMDLERERGITIKAHAVRLQYKAEDGENYILNLIDTPGHVDFSYEVSRSLACCEGSLLVVDATQGVEAQTVANAYLAIDHNHEIIPVINKIDLPQADSERVKQQIEDILGIDSKEAILASAKEGIGTKEILEAVIKKIPPPKGNPNAPLRAMIFDSWFDNYLGVIILVRVFDGNLKTGMKIKLFATGKEYEVQRLGILTPYPKDIEKLSAGEVGFVVAGIKNIADTKIGDTVTEAVNPSSEPLPGFREVKPMVFCGLYPTETHQYEELKTALEKLRLNDSSFFFEPETSAALGFGFRCGFLGLLHMEIIKERLEREFNLSLISTAPTVRYKIIEKNGEAYLIENPSKMPKVFEAIEEPYMKVSIIVPENFVGDILKLCQERRGIQKEFSYITKDRILLVYEIPLNEILWDFYDKLKSLSKGYASMDYELLGYRPSDLVKLDILINGEKVDALSVIVHKEKAYYRGRAIAQKLREVIPRQLFEVVIQAAIGGKIIARESIAPLRKNVLAKCYGGDVTRKKKLLEKQKEGKKRMKQIGKVEIPQEAFLSVLKVE